jgi:hypothetical protein
LEVRQGKLRGSETAGRFSACRVSQGQANPGSSLDKSRYELHFLLLPLPACVILHFSLSAGSSTRDGQRAMPNQTTDSSVQALVAAFSGALDVFKRIRLRRRKKRLSDEEVRLTSSLRRGPHDIQNEYNRNYKIAGEKFRNGDCMAKTTALSSVYTIELC